MLFFNFSFVIRIRQHALRIHQTTVLTACQFSASFVAGSPYEVYQLQDCIVICRVKSGRSDIQLRRKEWVDNVRHRLNHGHKSTGRSPLNAISFYRHHNGSAQHGNDSAETTTVEEDRDKRQWRCELSGRRESRATTTTLPRGKSKDSVLQRLLYVSVAGIQISHRGQHRRSVKLADVDCTIICVH